MFEGQFMQYMQEEGGERLQSGHSSLVLGLEYHGKNILEYLEYL